MSEVRTTSSTGGEKGVKEERFDLIPPEALAELARIYAMGSRKYKDHNYRLGYDWSKSYASLQRHANQWWSGEDTDEESGLSHIMHAAWHCFALYMFLLEHPEFDDRLSTVRKQSKAELPEELKVDTSVQDKALETALMIANLPYNFKLPENHPFNGVTYEKIDLDSEDLPPIVEPSKGLMQVINSYDAEKISRQFGVTLKENADLSDELDWIDKEEM